MRLRILVSALTLALTLAAPGVAYAATGDDPTATAADATTTASVATEAAFDAWLNDATLAVEAPAGYIWTTTKPQLRSYWCGPASIQTALSAFNINPSQQQIATYLGTTTKGSDFTRVDDALRYFSGRWYTYATVWSTSGLRKRIEWGIGKAKRPSIVDVRIYASIFTDYNYDHAGHILCVDGYDWRSDRLRVNDSFDEHYWYSGGGETLGHKFYPADVLWAGVNSHFRHAVVY
jgi:hypothetical protein